MRFTSNTQYFNLKKDLTNFNKVIYIYNIKNLPMSFNEASLSSFTATYNKYSNLSNKTNKLNEC